MVTLFVVAMTYVSLVGAGPGCDCNAHVGAPATTQSIR